MIDEIKKDISNLIAAEKMIGILRMQIIEQMTIQQKAIADMSQKGIMEAMTLIPMIEIMKMNEQHNVEFSQKTSEEYKGLKQKFDAEE